MALAVIVVSLTLQLATGMADPRTASAALAALEENERRFKERVMKIRIDLGDVPRCSKAGCKHRGLMHRHHTSHQWMFVKALAPMYHGQKKYTRFVKAYHRFNKKDVELLCPGHHGEIHELYDTIIIRYCMRRYKHPSLMTWHEINQLMALLKRKYLAWKDIETNISNPPTDRLEPWSADDD